MFLLLIMLFVYLLATTPDCIPLHEEYELYHACRITTAVLNFVLDTFADLSPL